MEELRAALIKRPSSRARHFSRRQLTVIAALVMATLAVYGALVLTFARPKRVSIPERVAPPREDGLELQVAHEYAQAWAARWRSDAQLIGVATQWQLTGGDRLAPDRPSWSFSFYSPAAGLIQIITVDRSRTQAVREVLVSQAPVPVEADWRLGSDGLLLAFLAHGGDEFIREHAHANLHFRLSGQDAGRPIWYLSAIDPVARESFVVGVDALSRQVVLTSEEAS